MIEAAELESGPQSVPPGASPAGAATAGAATAGAMLRQAREAAGLHLPALAVFLKVPAAKLEALEQDKYERLPDAVFARALAAAICRHLKIDPQPVLDRLPQTAAPRLARDTDGLNMPFRSPRDSIVPDWREHLTRPVSLVVAALLLGALVLVLLPRSPEPEPEPESTAAAGPTTAISQSPAGPQDPATARRGIEVAAAATPSAASAMPPPPAGIVPASISAPAAPVALAPAAVTAPAPAAAASATPATASGLVVFRTKAASWVEVVDAKGVVAVRKLMAPGESAGASGAVPLQVTIGKVDATEVQVRGKPFDLKPFARDNVARFEVK